MPCVEYSLDNYYIVVFVASHGKRAKGHAFEHNEGNIPVGAAAPIFWRSVEGSENPEHMYAGMSLFPRNASAGIDQYQSEVDSPGDQPSSNSDVSSSPGTTRRSCHESRRSLSTKSEETESSDQSDDSLDDDELYDQLLRKFTGHGLRERETGDERNDEYNERGADAQDDANADEDGTAHVSTHVEAGDTDNIIDGNADDKAIDRDDKSDSQNRDLHR